MKPADNRDRLVATNVSGRIAPVRLSADMLFVDDEGKSVVLPGAGGINVGVHCGDRVGGWISDHLMPGASLEDVDGSPTVPGALHLLSCIGNTVRSAKGQSLGVIAGKRGGLAPGNLGPHLVSAEISDVTAGNLFPEDRVVVEALGRGLKLEAWPEIELMNLSPRLLDSLPLSVQDGVLRCLVRAIVPATAAGAGLGQDPWVGDLEIAGYETVDGKLDDLCFGDLVAFDSINSRTSRFYQPDMVSVGLVSHGPSHVPGHGIGITILMSGQVHCLHAIVALEGSVASELRRWGLEPPSGQR
jgi:Domain of unknown function (DUF4438)